MIGNFDRLREQFSQDFPGHELFLEKLQAQKRMNAHRHLFQFLELAKLYHKDDMIKAIGVCMQYNVFNASFISGFLEKHCQQTIALSRPGEQLFLKLIPKGPVTRDLNEYRLTINEQTQGE